MFYGNNLRHEFQLDKFTRGMFWCDILHEVIFSQFGSRVPKNVPSSSEVNERLRKLTLVLPFLRERGTFERLARLSE